MRYGFWIATVCTLTWMLSACGGDGGGGTTPGGTTVQSFTASETEGDAPLATEFRWEISSPDNAVACSLNVDGDGEAEYEIENCLSTTTQAHTYAAAGTYTASLVVTDAAGGSVTETTRIVVAEPGGGGGTDGGGTGGETISVRVASDVSWAAFQDGDGIWTPLEIGETAELSVSGEAFGLAYVCEEEEGNTLTNLFYTTVSAFENVSANFPFSRLECSEAVPGPPPYLTLSGAVGGVAMDEGGNVSFGTSGDIFYNESEESKLSYTLDTVLAGRADLVATTGPILFSTPDGPPTRGIIQRGLEVSADTMRDLDFNAEGVALESNQVEVTNLNILDNSFSGNVFFLSEGGTTHAGLANTDASEELSGGSLSFDYASFPAPRPGDRYGVKVVVRPEGDETGCERTSNQVLETSQDVSVALLECFEIGVDVTTTTPYVRPAATVSEIVDVSAATSGRYVYSQLENLLDVSVSFLGNERTDAFTTYQLPDFSATQGWDNAWGLSTGETVRYAATFSFGADIFETFGDTGDGLNETFSEAEGDTVTVRGTVTP